MSKIKKGLNHIGLWLDESEDEQDQNTSSKYTVKNKAKAMEKLVLHRDFLRSLSAEENVRLSIIENKTTQLFGQTGVVFALLSLFVPLIVDKIDGWYLKLPFLIILFFAFYLYLLAIHHAVKNYNVKNFRYSNPSPNNVLNYQDKSEEDFLIEEINDLLHSTKINAEINNNKASNLIYSSNSFRLANILTAFLAFLLCLSLLLTKPNKEPIKIEGPIKIENSVSPTNQ